MPRFWGVRVDEDGKPHLSETEEGMSRVYDAEGKLVEATREPAPEDAEPDDDELDDACDGRDALVQP